MSNPVADASDYEFATLSTSEGICNARHKNQDALRRSLFVLTDLCGIWGGALIAIALRFHFGFGESRPYRTLVMAHFGLVLLYSVLIVLFCHTQRLYSANQLASFRREVVDILKAVLMASVLLSASLFVSGVKTASRLVVIATAVSAVTTMAGWRYSRRHLLRKASPDGLSCHNAVIVGTGPLARAVGEYLSRHRQLGFVVRGFVRTEGRAPGLKILGDIEDLFTLCRKHFVDEVIICDHNREIVKRIIAEGRSSGVGVRVIPDLYDGMAWGAEVDYLGEFPSLAVHHRDVPLVEMKLKRVLDVVFSAGALFVLSPVMLLVAILIKLDSKGPALYVSKRVAKKGRIFSCYKFRTMVSDAEALKDSLQHLNERDGILFKINNDPRITRIGRILRKYSLDELPQLWNVLRGDMSLVGPRPPLANEVQQYELEYLRRLEMSPGITGLWQVEARSSPSFDRYIALDLHYVEQWSFLMDLKILCRTVPVMFAGTGQ